jgi:predicted nucleotidyltransferase
MQMNEALKQIVKQLKPVDPYKIVLFGSQAKGIAKEDSDIDLMVILDNWLIPKTYAEDIKRYVFIRTLLLNINAHYGMDVKVYSRAEFQDRKENGSFFIEEIEKTGIVIYEKYH